MKIPREFFIRGSLWTTEYKWNLTFKGKRIDGLIDPDKRVIYIDRSLGVEDKFWTFKHEWRHAVWDAYECSYSFKISGAMDREEKMSEALDIEERNTFNIKWKKK
jgi:Zn-dependent peptidase ImmA (M78 family)